MHPVDFRKGRMEHFLNSIKNGTPLEKVNEARDLLLLAGACLFVVLSHGPVEHLPLREDLKRKGMDEEAIRRILKKIPIEHREATSDRFIGDLLAAVNYCAHMAMAVMDGDYDDQFEPDHLAYIGWDFGSAPPPNVLVLKGAKPR
jgi:hypothetical protein